MIDQRWWLRDDLNIRTRAVKCMARLHGGVVDRRLELVCLMKRGHSGKHYDPFNSVLFTLAGDDR